MLDRLDALFSEARAPTSFELLALTRHLFESLVWARLFNADQGYGLIFCKKLIEDQIDSQDRQLQQLEAEVVLFGECEALEKAAVDETLGAVIREGNLTEAAILAAQEESHARSAALDVEVRRSFSLYADAARFNGYGYQSQIIRDQIIPKHKAARAEHIALLDALNVALPALLSERLLKIGSQRWNWGANAELVGMGKQYKYLYSLTSRLLHATPMNIMTDHELSVGEITILHEYVFVAVGDTLECIEAFRFEGQSHVLLIDVDAPKEA